MKVFVLLFFIAAILATMNSCGFLGIGGSKSNEPGLLKGNVQFKDDEKPLLDGLVRVNYNGVEVSKNIAVREGAFKVAGLTPGCCYVIIFEDPKSGVRLGLDTNITIKGGENERKFSVLKPGPEYMNLPPDTANSGGINIPPKP